jgi:hypothetical protein
MPLCPFAAITRRPCPGCGLTRATLALAQGHVREAVAFHPLAPLISPLVVGFVGYSMVTYVREGRWPALGRRMAAAGIALWALLVGVWIARFFGAFGGPVPVGSWSGQG